MISSGPVLRPFPRVAPSHGGAKPKVLLVDDHRQVLDSIAGILAGDFDIAAAATDGYQALDAALKVAPDVIVLDVTMPGLDGFQTCQALEQAGSRAPVVFLSMHDGDDYVREAFRRGGRGYVLKSRAPRDLTAAIDQALLGRVFVPSLTALSRMAGRGGHAMILHEDREPLLNSLAGYFDLALRLGDATCVIADEPTREGLTARLRERGWDVGASGDRRYRVIDVDEAVSESMRNGRPDADLLAGIAQELDEFRLAAGASRLTLYGTMVMSLHASGNRRAVLEIERIWGAVARDLPILTLCGYAAACFHDDVPEWWTGARTEHWALSHG